MSEKRDQYGHPIAESTDRSNTHQSIKDSYNSNSTLPWIFITGCFAVFALGMTYVQDQRITDFNTQLANLNSQITNIVATQTASISSLEASQARALKEVHDIAWDAKTESLMYKEHVDQLEHQMAAHGIVPPPKKDPSNE